MPPTRSLKKLYPSEGALSVLYWQVDSTVLLHCYEYSLVKVLFLSVHDINAVIEISGFCVEISFTWQQTDGPISVAYDSTLHAVGNE